MADATTATTTSENSVAEDETPTQRQARLRREKRQKKMAEQGEDRLARIKALNGGVAPPPEILGGPTPAPPPAPAPASTAAAPSAPAPPAPHASVDDPDEADISTVSGPGTPGAARPAALDDEWAAAMRQMQQPPPPRRAPGQGGAGTAGGVGGGTQGGGGGSDDPMVQMMQQLAGLTGGPGNAPPTDPNQPPGDLPPFLQALLNAEQTEREAAKTPPTGGASVWRIVHAVFAGALAIYVALSSAFTGTEHARHTSVYAPAAGAGPRLFVLFASAELLLQSTRFFLERGQLSGSGTLATVANSGLVPEPYAQYVRTLGRYAGIAQTILSDAMVIVFVCGAWAWWNGTVTS